MSPRREAPSSFTRREPPPHLQIAMLASTRNGAAFGQRVLDPSVEKGPQAFRRHMLEAWDAVVEDGFGDD